MLEEILVKYEGTLLLVSHDRDFLDQTVTKILSFEGAGHVKECIGGYSDYLSKASFEKNKTSGISPGVINKNLAIEDKGYSAPYKPKKLTFKLDFELTNLPTKIQETEEGIKVFLEQLADPNFYQKDPKAFLVTSKKLEEAKKNLERYETRWLELEELRGQ